MNKKLLIAFVLSAFIVSSYGVLAASHGNKENKQNDLRKKQEQLKNVQEELKRLQGQNDRDDKKKMEDKKVMKISDVDVKEFDLPETKMEEAKKIDVMQNRGTERSELEKNLRIKRDETKAMIKKDRATFQSDTRARLETFKDATPEERTQIKADIQAKREGLQTQSKTLRQNLVDNAKETRDKFRDRVKDVDKRAKLVAGHSRALMISKHFRTALARFDHIIKRIDSRIEKMADKNIDTDAFTPLIEELKNMRVDIETAIEELKERYESFLDSDKLKDLREEARTMAKDIGAQFKELSNKIKDVVKSLKDAQEDVQPVVDTENDTEQ